MTQYAKYVSEDYVKFPPKNLKTPTLIAFGFDKNESLLKEQGYLELVELNNPEEVTDETHWAKPQYALIENEESNYITVQYVAEEITDEGDE